MRNFCQRDKRRFVEIEAELRTGVDVDARVRKIRHDMLRMDKGGLMYKSRAVHERNADGNISVSHGSLSMQRI